MSNQLIPKKIGIAPKGLYLYAIPKHDDESSTKQWYVGPFLSPSDDLALSAFAEIAKTEPSLQRTYLYKIGYYNCETGKLTALTHTLVRSVTSKKKEKKNEKKISH